MSFKVISISKATGNSATRTGPPAGTAGSHSISRRRSRRRAHRHRDACNNRGWFWSVGINDRYGSCAANGMPKLSPRKNPPCACAGVARVAAATAVAASEAPTDGSVSDHCTACTPPALLRLTTMPRDVRVLGRFLDGAHLPRAMGERVQKEALRTLAALAYDQTPEGRIIPLNRRIETPEITRGACTRDGSGPRIRLVVLGAKRKSCARPQ